MILLEDVIGYEDAGPELLEVVTDYINLLNKYGAESKEEIRYFGKIVLDKPEFKPFVIKALNAKKLFDAGMLI